MPDETEMVVKRYLRRQESDTPRRYSALNWEVLMSFQERQRALVRVLRSLNRAMEELRVVEVGCGAGRNLLELIYLGVNPQNLVGIELLEDRAEAAKQTLPSAVHIQCGDASKSGLESASFDIVYQSTVFTSILDDGFQEQLANEMWRCVAPGGGVLWYDFVFDNPSNADVRGVTLKRVEELFPQGHLLSQRMTLAPPISRRICRRSPHPYSVVNAVPWLRSHVLCWIGKGKT